MGIAEENKYDFEIIAVNDGSEDKTWGVIERYAKRYEIVKGINFMGNHGQSAAYQAGFDLSKGDYVIDAGANFGLFAIPANDKVGRSGKIFAFEPIKKTMHILKKNLVANKTKKCLTHTFCFGTK